MHGTEAAPPQQRSARFVSLLTRDTLALVLAGGRGTRLGALTSDRVKPAVPFAGKYRLIDFPLSNCINSGIRRMGVLTQYKAHSLINHLHNAWGFLRSEFNEFVEILPAQQRTGSAWYEGTADAVWQNFEIIRAHAPQFVLVLGGDHVYKMDYGAMLGFHVERGAAVTVGCLEVPAADATGFGVMGTDADGRVRRFQEKPSQPAEVPGKPGYALASMGIYVFDAAYLQQALRDDAERPGSSRDFGKDILPHAVEAGDRVYAFPFRDPDGNTQGYWRDVGTLDSYWHANLELTAVTPPLDLYDRDWPVWTYQVQAPPAKFVFNDFRRRGMAVDSMVSGGCIVSGAMIRRSLLGPFVRVEDYSLLDECVVLADARIRPRCRIKRAIIETGCVVPEGTVIGENPDDDRRRFEVSEGGVVLVTPEMLGQELTYVR
jgi:glucose-1-phosphate adenylyltransferase